MNTDDSIDNRLRDAREWAGLSQQEAADGLGIARELISYWEHDRRVPSLAQLVRLAATYGTTIDYLTGRAPAPGGADEHALLYQGIDAGEPRTRGAVRRWLTFLDAWAALLEETGDRLPGRDRPPRELEQADGSATDSRRAPALAEAVRRHYQLGRDAIPDLFAFLDERRVLVFRMPLGPLDGPGDVSGIYYNHPRLGACILVNTDTTPGRQVFTLAHEFAHALFHHRETGLVSRAGDRDRKERFADVFAGHFLVPSATLRALVERGADGCVRDPLEVIRLQHYFGVSYATMLYRLFSEGLLTQGQYDEYRGYSPSHLAARLGLPAREYYRPSEAAGGTLRAYPPSVLERVRALIEADELSPVAAASLLDVAPEAILGDLLAKPEGANWEELREFAELPAPPRPRRSRAETRPC